MSNRQERLITLILWHTEYMSNLRRENLNEALECVNLLDPWTKFNSVDEILEIKNKHIQETINEIKSNKELLKMIIT